jgi:hypothetical protein
VSNRREAQLSALAERSRQMAAALRSMAAELAGGEAKRKARGRPSRAARSVPAGAEAPLPELVTKTSKQLLPQLQRIDDPELLRRCYRYEARHDRRSGVLQAIERILRRLGSPIGGPSEPPIANYDELDPLEIVGRLLRQPELAAEVYAYEWYHRRRAEILEPAEETGGDAAARRVAETDPARREIPPEPFPGFGELSTSPATRKRMRAVLRDCDRSALERALAYERATRRRAVILKAIHSALREKS